MLGQRARSNASYAGVVTLHVAHLHDPAGSPRRARRSPSASSTRDAQRLLDERRAARGRARRATISACVACGEHTTTASSCSSSSSVAPVGRTRARARSARPAPLGHGGSGRRSPTSSKRSASAREVRQVDGLGDQPAADHADAHRRASPRVRAAAAARSRCCSSWGPEASSRPPSTSSDAPVAYDASARGEERDRRARSRRRRRPRADRDHRAARSARSPACLGRVVHRRGRVAGRDGVDRDAVRRQLERHHLRQHARAPPWPRSTPRRRRAGRRRGSR